MAEGSSPNGPTVGLMAWQGTEDSLKALCVGHGIPYSHKPSQIMSHIHDNNLLGLHEFNDLALGIQSVTMSGSYNDIRYPGTDPKFWDNMPPDQIVSRATAAKKIYEICLNNLATSGITP